MKWQLSAIAILGVLLVGLLYFELRPRTDLRPLAKRCDEIDQVLEKLSSSEARLQSELLGLDKSTQIMIENTGRLVAEKEVIQGEIAQIRQELQQMERALATQVDLTGLRAQEVAAIAMPPKLVRDKPKLKTKAVRPTKTKRVKSSFGTSSTFSKSR
jgi:hypothetical protein